MSQDLNLTSLFSTHEEKYIKRWQWALRLVVIFCTWRKKCRKWRRASQLIVIFCNWNKITKNNDELGFGSSLSFALEEKTKKRWRVGIFTCCHFLQLKKNQGRGGVGIPACCCHWQLRNKTKRWRWAGRLIVVFYNWKKCKKNKIKDND